ETASPYLALLDTLHISHSDYTTQALLIFLATAIITTYLVSIRWLSETLLAQDAPVLVFSDGNTQARQPSPTSQGHDESEKPAQQEQQQQQQQQQHAQHHIALRSLVYCASAIFFALPALYLHRHPPALLQQPSLILTLRPLLRYTFLTLALYLALTLLLATLFLFAL